MRRTSPCEPRWMPIFPAEREAGRLSPHIWQMDWLISVCWVLGLKSQRSQATAATQPLFTCANKTNNHLLFGKKIKMFILDFYWSVDGFVKQLGESSLLQLVFGGGACKEKNMHGKKIHLKKFLLYPSIWENYRESSIYFSNTSWRTNSFKPEDTFENE